MSNVMNPNDRGQCLAIVQKMLTPPHIRCAGRMIAQSPLLWVCSDCGKEVHHERPAEVMHFDLDRTPRNGADTKKRKDVMA